MKKEEWEENEINKDKKEQLEENKKDECKKDQKVMEEGVPLWISESMVAMRSRHQQQHHQHTEGLARLLPGSVRGSSSAALHTCGREGG